MTPPVRIKILRELVNGLFQLAKVEVPRLDWANELEQMTPQERRWEEMDKNDGWIKSCHRVLDILEGQEGEVTYDEVIQQESWASEEDPYWLVEFMNKNEYAYLGASISSWGDYLILNEYNINGTWKILWEGMPEDNPPNPIDVAQKVTSEEMTYLTRITGSCKVSLDYWQTELSPEAYSQKEWADIRGVRRQTVNDSIRAATNAINESDQSPG